MLQKKKQTRHLSSGFSGSSFRAFTLAEMILVVALTLFLLTVTVQGFVNSASQFSYANVAEKVESMIRYSRSLAISGKAQIDYTDFDKDGCKDVATTGACGEDDYVTPANYGVNLDKTTVSGVDTYTLTLFADNHSPTPADEGAYNPGTVLADYQGGKDIILEQFVVPSSMVLIIPGGTSATIFYSPVFADISSDISILPSDPFFRFGISQMQGTILRKRCSQIHLLAGISEPITTGMTGNPTVCP
jgi:type II secretory pathway pseudopilin PulG